MKDGLNSSMVGPRPDYRDTKNIPDNIAQKYREQMNLLMQKAKLNLNNKSFCGPRQIKYVSGIGFTVDATKENINAFLTQIGK